MYCGKCGTFYPDNVQFCPNCGEENKKYVPPVKHKKSSGAVVAAVIAVLLIAAGVVTTVFLTKRQPEDNSETTTTTVLAAKEVETKKTGVIKHKTPGYEVTTEPAETTTHETVTKETSTRHNEAVTAPASVKSAKNYIGNWDGNSGSRYCVISVSQNTDGIFKIIINESYRDNYEIYYSINAIFNAKTSQLEYNKDNVSSYCIDFGNGVDYIRKTCAVTSGKLCYSDGYITWYTDADSPIIVRKCNDQATDIEKKLSRSPLSYFDEDNGYYGYIEASERNKLNIRSSFSDSSELRATLKQDDIVYVFGTYKGWSYIEYYDSMDRAHYGWIKSNSVTDITDIIYEYIDEYYECVDGYEIYVDEIIDYIIDYYCESDYI